MVVGLLSHTAIIGLRSQETGHGPYTTSFEVAVFLSWLVVVVYCFTHWKIQDQGFGIVRYPGGFLILLYATFLSKEIVDFPESEFRILLTLHRTLSIIGFAAFAIAFGLGVMYLIQEKQVKSKKLGMMYFRMPSLESLDNLTYKAVAVGFPLFTMGFLTGDHLEYQDEPVVTVFLGIGCHLAAGSGLDFIWFGIFWTVPDGLAR